MNDTLDDALERLRGVGTEVAGSVAPNHGPMAAEALVALGYGDLVAAWAERYRRKLDVMPASRSPIAAEGGAEALGAVDRFADWVEFFRARLAEAPWQTVFGEWISRLLPATPSAGATDSFVPRTQFARCHKPRLRCASKSSGSPWRTGLVITASSPAPRVSPVRSI